MYRNQAIERIRVRRANARAMRKAKAFICDGLAMLGTVALIVALAGAAIAVQVERANASDMGPCDGLYNLVQVWQGHAYVVDYNLTREDCDYALAHSVGDMSCVLSAMQ